MGHRPSSTDAGHAHERFWRLLNGTPGEILWEADAGNLQDDVGHFAAAFGQRLPVVDLGCGDGRQTRFLARHFATVIGLDIAAIERAKAAPNPVNVTYRMLDARDPGAASALHDEIGDANVYIRGVLHARPPDARRLVVETIARLLGHAGTLFIKELSPEARARCSSSIPGVSEPSISARLAPALRPGDSLDATAVTFAVPVRASTSWTPVAGAPRSLKRISSDAGGDGSRSLNGRAGAPLVGRSDNS